MKHFISVALFTVLAAGISSCTKEHDNLIITEETLYDTISTQKDNRILEYSIANVNDDYTIYSAIDDSAATITVYLPAYYELGIIQPEIKLSEGASISPSADEPVPVFEDKPFIYKVTGKDGLKATYTVNIIVQQQDFQLTELTKTPTSPKTYNSATGSLSISATNLLASYTVTKCYLVNEQGERVYRLADTQSTPKSNKMSFLYGTAGSLDPVPAGLYWVEISSYAITKRMQNPIRMQ